MFSNHGYKFEVQMPRISMRISGVAWMRPRSCRLTFPQCRTHCLVRLRHIEPFRSELAAAPALETTLFLHLAGLGI